MAWSQGLKALCCAIVAVTLMIVLSIVMVIGKSSPISVQGSDAHIQEVNQVKSSLLEINNRVNLSGVGLGAVLLLVVLIILARAVHHMIVKRPGKVVKRATKAEFESKVEKMEEVLKAKGYLS